MRALRIVGPGVVLVLAAGLFVFADSSDRGSVHERPSVQLLNRAIDRTLAASFRVETTYTPPPRINAQPGHTITEVDEAGHVRITGGFEGVYLADASYFRSKGQTAWRHSSGLVTLQLDEIVPQLFAARDLPAKIDGNWYTVRTAEPRWVKLEVRGGYIARALTSDGYDMRLGSFGSVAPVRKPSGKIVEERPVRPGAQPANRIVEHKRSGSA